MQWITYEFDELVTLQNKKYYQNKSNTITPCIELEHIEQKTGNLLGYTDANIQKSTKNHFYKDNILYGKLRPYLKKYYLAEFDGVCSTEFLVFSANEKIIYKEYLYLLLQTDRFTKYANVSSGSKMPRAEWSYIKKCVFKLPSKIEQKKISTIIIDFEKLIRLKKKELENTELIKKSLLNQIYNKNMKVSNSPKKEYKLSELLTERKMYSQKGKEYPHVTLSKEGIFDKKSRYDRDFLVRQKDKKYKITRYNDICFNPANLKFGVLCLNKYGDAIFSPIYVTLVANERVDADYIGYYMMRKDFINKIRKYEEGTVYERMAVKTADMLKHRIVIPSIEEQRKTSEIFKAFDKKVFLLEKEIKLLEKQKKGLMQQLLTGLIRVNVDEQ